MLIEQMPPYPTDVKLAIVSSRFNRFIVERLSAGATRCLEENKINTAATHIKVPGAFEIPVVVKTLLDTGEYDAIITLGAVIRGETPHFDYICTECAHGISQLSIQYGVPVIFGVLTVDNVDQANDRSGDDESNKGYEAVAAALEMIGVLGQIK